MVFQHGDEIEDHDRVHQWCLKAGDDDAQWLAAVTKDRWLMHQGKPQLYGALFRKVEILWEASVTDEERAKWNVPTLAESKERADERGELRAPRSRRTRRSLADAMSLLASSTKMQRVIAPAGDARLSSKPSSNRSALIEAWVLM
jgi:hypothetical protein